MDLLDGLLLGLFLMDLIDGLRLGLFLMDLKIDCVWDHFLWI
jgi:hypothetical protein